MTSCRECEYCLKDLDSLCVEGYQIFGYQRQGGYAEEVAMPADVCIPLEPDDDPVGFPDGVNYMLRATLEPVGGGGSAEYTYLTAGIARSAGLQGSLWRSKVGLLNRSGGAASTTLSYVRPSTTTTAQVNLIDGELVAWDNVLEDLFGLERSAGLGHGSS